MSLRSALIVWTFALALSAGAVALIVASDHELHKGLTLALAGSIGLAYVSGGLVAWVRRPENGTGRLMTFVGFIWFLGALQEANADVFYTVGAALGALPLAAFVHLVLAFPRGYLEWLARPVAVAGYVLALVVAPLLLLVEEPTAEVENLPRDVFLVAENGTAAAALGGLLTAGALVVFGAVIAIFASRWRTAEPRLRRQLGPVYVTSTTALVLFGVLISVESSGGWSRVLSAFALMALLAVPLSFLLVLLRGHLTRTEERNRALLDAIPDLLFVFTREGRYKNVKAERQELLVAPAEELLGARIADVLPQDLAEGFVAAIGRALDEGALQTYEYRLAVDGTLRTFEARLVPSGEDEVTGIVRDFTDLRRLEEELQARFDELRTSEERLRALIEAAPAAIVEVDLEDRVTRWNPAAERIFGWPAAEVVGGSMPVVPPADVPGVKELRGRARGGETVSGLEALRLRRDGSLVDVEVSVAPVRDATGQVVSHLAVYTDITERKRLFEQLRRERDFIQAVVDNTSAIFLVVDVEGRIVRFNRACEIITGHDDDQGVRGRRFWEVFVVPEEREEAMLALADVVAGRPPPEQETEWIRSDGSRVVIAWTIVPITDEYGIQRYLVSGADVTVRKLHEEEIAASRARIVMAADAERRRLERNLHDGAQQRLVTLSLALRLAQSRLARDPEGARAILDEAHEELQLGLAELRELARGIHPAVLTDRGLGPALEMLASRAPLPVDIRAVPAERLPEPVEAAAYYVVSEALANVAKYAQATAASVSVVQENGRALVEIADDGIGGADPTRGSGIRGLADRIASLQGRLDVESPRGEGTRVRAEIPCG